MGNALEFILKLTDQLSPALRAATSVSDSAAARISGDLDKISGRGRAMSASISDLRQKLEQVNQVRLTTRISSQFSDATREARRLEQQIDKLESKGKSGGGLGIGSLLAGAGAYGLGKATIGAAADREQQQISFGVMTGSKATGNKMIKDLVDMGAQTPFESADLIKNAQVMKQFNIENEKILPNLRMLGDVSGGNADKLGALTLAFSQVTSAQKLQGGDLIQFINAGFNPLSEIAEITGIKYAKLREQMERGAISSEMVTKAFEHATGEGGKFHNMMEQQSQTMAGKWSTLLDNGKSKLLELGTALAPAVGWLIDMGSALLADTPTLITIVSLIGVLTLGIKGAAWATRIWAFAQGALNAVMAMNPIVLVITAIVALAGVVIYAYNHFAKFRGFVFGAWEAIQGFGGMIKDFFIDVIKGLVQGIAGVGQALYYLFNGEWQKAWETGTEAAKNLIGVNAIKHAMDNGKKMGVAVSAGYNEGVGQLALKPAQAVPKVKGAGVNPVTAADFKGLGSGAGADGGGGGSAKGKSDSINAGGSRPITITIGKQVETLNVHVANAKETAEEIETLVRESMRRVLYSLNSMAVN